MKHYSHSLFFHSLLMCGLLAVLAVAAPSCSPEQVEPVPRRGDMSLRISLDTGGSAQTRSAASESRVSDIAVMLFTVDAQGAPGMLYDCLQARNLSPRNGGYDFDVTIGLDSADVPDRLAALLICNAGTSIFQTIVGMKGKSLAEISASLEIPFSVAGCDEVTMSGICSPVIETSLAAQQLRASVIRDRARIDVSASDVEADVFSLSEVYVYRHVDRLALLPGATLPSVPASAHKVPSDRFPATPISNSIEAQVYIPEADVLMGGEGDPNDSGRMNRTAIVVGGCYRGAEAMSYYRIDFTGDDGRLVDILRNHQYVVNITDVKGPGSPTPDEAYSSISAGVSATLLDWDRQDTHIVFDGAHWFSVESRSQLIGPDAGNKALLSLATDIPSSEWRMAWTAAGETSLPEDMSPQVTVDGEWFRVTRPVADDLTGGASLVFEALSPLPDGILSRTQTLHILAGERLHLWVTVTQCDLASSPWIDGGEIEFNQ